MVALLDKTTRLSRGIDTIKRQIIYAALASREASSGIEAYTESIKIAGPSTPSDSTAPSLLTIGVILDCARNKAFHSYLNILENINPYSTVTPPQYDTVPASTGLYLARSWIEIFAPKIPQCWGTLKPINRERFPQNLVG